MYRLFPKFQIKRKTTVPESPQTSFLITFSNALIWCDIKNGVLHYFLRDDSTYICSVIW
jgi:hypothetical protein